MLLVSLARSSTLCRLRPMKVCGLSAPSLAVTLGCFAMCFSSSALRPPTSTPAFDSAFSTTLLADSALSPAECFEGERSKSSMTGDSTVVEE